MANDNNPSLKTTPLSVIAHRLRTPLTVITSTLNNLLDGAFGSMKPDQKKWIEKVAAHTAHLEALQNDIINLLKEDISDAEKILAKIEGSL